MATSERIAVTPAVLTWARKSAGYSLEDAAKKLPAPIDSLKKWESGDLSPTIKQLRKLGKRYRRPLAVLLLPQPPTDFDAIRDFRKGNKNGETPEWSPALHAEFRRAVSQRDVFLELAELAPGVLPDASDLPSVVAGDPEAAARQLSATLGVEVGQGWSTSYDFLKDFVGAVEQLGVLVVHTGGVPISEIRGFSISEWPFPVIALNGSDFPRPRAFSPPSRTRSPGDESQRSMRPA